MSLFPKKVEYPFKKHGVHPEGMLRWTFLLKVQW